MSTLKTFWFIEPLSAETNQSIAAELAKTADVCEAIDLPVGDGSEHHAFQLPSYHLVSMIYAAKDKFGLKFRVYRRQGKYGKIEEWHFGAKKKKVKI